MTKLYELKETGTVGDELYTPGEVFEIRKLQEPVRFNHDDDKVYRYIVVGQNELLSKEGLKQRFNKLKGQSKTKKVINTLIVLTLYELTKKCVYELEFRLQHVEPQEPLDHVKNGREW
ncbi:hypothetical protein ABDK10_05400 [Staphylococcus aureus]